MKQLDKGAKQAKLPKKLGRRACDSKTAAAAEKRQIARCEKNGWPVNMGAYAAAVNELNLDVNVTGLNGQGKQCNFLGHLINHKNSMIDKHLVLAAKNGNFDSFITNLAAEKVVGANKFDYQALNKKIGAHHKHYAENGSVSFANCCSHVGLKNSRVIGEALYNLLNEIKNTLKA